jgi:MFS family permease
VGVLITFSPEFAKVLGYQDPILAGRSIMYTYTGLIFGDFLSGFISQYFKSRKKVVAMFILLSFLFIIIYLFVPGKTSFYFYSLCVLLGFAIGYWAVFVTIASEQFGTNIRSTVTTTVPNFVRGAVVPITLAFELFKGSLGMIYSALVVGIITIIIALFALYHLNETFGKDLDYIEHI